MFNYIINKMKHKLLLAFILLFSWNALYAVQIGSLYYALDDLARKAYLVSPAYGEYSGDIIIPSY